MLDASIIFKMAGIGLGVTVVTEFLALAGKKDLANYLYIATGILMLSMIFSQFMNVFAQLQSTLMF